MKKTLIKPVFINCVLLAISWKLSAQKIDSALDTFATRFPVEKIYIHYDKEYYVTGETIWLKAYFYNNGKPSGISSNLFIQFIDANGRIITDKRYPIRGASAQGNIDIPDSLPQGNYYIRALTPEMLNYDEAFIYKKSIFIFKPGVSVPKEPGAAPKEVSVQFFPEGGDLVSGLLSVVALKATDERGMPVEVSGIVKTDDGTTIASFKSFHDGIGKVQFKPQAGKKYSADIDINGNTKRFFLPEVKATGMNLKVQNEKGGKVFQLSRTDGQKEQFEDLLLVAQMNNRVVYENEINFGDYPSVRGHLLTDSLPSGILHFTVFNKNGIPLAERLSFVDNHEYIATLSLSLRKQGAEKRAENNVELDFPEGIQRSCSISVTDASGAHLTSVDNIWSRFLLTSDLKGYIYNPAWYFERQNDSTVQALDNLMLTHGWSRFKWVDLLSNRFPSKKFTDTGFLSFTGEVRNDKDKTPVKGGQLNIYAEAEDSTTQNYEINVDANGQFRIDSIVFSGKGKFYYVYLNSQGKPRPVYIEVNRNNELEKAAEDLPAAFMEENEKITAVPGVNKEEIEQRHRYAAAKFNDVKELEKVTLPSQTNRKPIDIVNEKYTNGAFRTMGKVNLDNINDPANDKTLNVVDYIKNSIQQVEIQDGRFVNRKTLSLMSGQKWVVGLFLNEQPVDMFLLRTYRIDQVALIKFYESGFVGVGSGSPGGALAVYTKDASATAAKPDKLDHFEYNGYSIIKEFYSPDYKLAGMREDFVDNRTTLYWNPNVYTDPDTRSFQVKFFNNDFSKKFRIVVEGFDAAGKLLHLEKIIGN